jgi:hypothetical protein
MNQVATASNTSPAPPARPNWRPLPIVQRAGAGFVPVIYHPERITEHQQRRTEMEKTTVEIFIAMNEDGDFVVVKYESEALEQLASDCGHHARVVKLTVKMSPPQATEATVDVPDEAGETTEIEAAA